MVQILSGCKELKKLNYPRRPTGDIERQLLQHRCSSLATTVVERVGNVGALGIRPRASGVKRPHTKQITNVRDHPLLAGLDEPVLIQAGDVRFEHVILVLNQSQQGAKWLSLSRITQTVEGGQ